MAVPGRLRGSFADAAAALGLLVLSIMLYAETSSFHFDPKQPAAMGPAYMPRVWLVLMGILALLLLVQIAAGKSEESERLNHPWLVMLTLVISFAYLVVMPLVGYALTTLLFLICLLRCLGVRNRRVLAVTSVGFTVTAYLLFVRFLSVPLPSGSLWG